MAKKPSNLSFRDLVLGADTEVIRAALAAREQIDQLLAERTAAYERIAELENQIEDVVGDPGIYPFPAPPLPVAGFDPKADTVTRSAATKKPARPAPVRGTSPAADDESEAGETDDTDSVEASDEETDN